jgi:hypothetical protein
MKKPMKPAMKPVQPMTQPEEVAAAEAEVAAEILPQDGLTVIAEEEEEAAPVAESSNDPLPSVPVDEEPVQPTPAPAVGAMHYLGTFAMNGVVGRGGSKRPAGYPVVVKAADGHTVGVVVVGDPGDMNLALATSLEGAGHHGAPFSLFSAMTLDRPQKLAAARAIATQQDPALDRVGALAALGYTPQSLA